ncbi:hypothetical protein V1502_11690 [Bacillus sp. SCS-153A]|uniref:hypothetical protein n=1 Tax=Rossellomorea sedimentorum TaxID=3115294 RepID=UPI0039066E0C
MSQRENRFGYAQNREERRTITSLWEQMSAKRKDPYPSSFYKDSEEDSPDPVGEKIERKRDTIAPPLIFSPPPVPAVIRSSKKDEEDEEKEKKEEEEASHVPKKKKEEIIPVPDESIDEYLALAEKEKDADILSEDDYDFLFGDEEELADQADCEDRDEEETNESEAVEEKFEKPFEEKRNPFLVKLPVMLFKQKVEIDIFDSFNLMSSVTEVTNMSWRIKSFKGHAVLPSNTVFIKLILIGDLDFVSQNGTMHTLQMEVPLDRHIDVNWIAKPELSCAESHEYWFRTKYDQDISVHRSFEETLVSPVTFKYNFFDIIWHQEMITKPGGEQRVALKGCVELSMEGYQDQVVEIDRCSLD